MSVMCAGYSQPSLMPRRDGQRWMESSATCLWFSSSLNAGWLPYVSSSNGCAKPVEQASADTKPMALPGTNLTNTPRHFTTRQQCEETGWGVLSSPGTHSPCPCMQQSPSLQRTSSTEHTVSSFEESRTNSAVWQTHSRPAQVTENKRCFSLASRNGWAGRIRRRPHHQLRHVEHQESRSHVSK